METVAQRVDRLEQVMIELAEQSKITQREVARLSIEMRAFKDEMNKRWGELANKMGTLVEDIFIPSFDIMLKRYFGVTPKRISSRMKLRNENREIELDIVGFTEDKVFIVEVKSSPDRQGYIDDFIEKLRVLPEFLPEIKSYEVVPIYAGLTMSESTIESLTKNNIYALIVNGDILEIVNFDKVKKTEG
jgi:DNA-binding Lrp family transcriptional regulator